MHNSVAMPDILLMRRTYIPQCWLDTIITTTYNVIACACVFMCQVGQHSETLAIRFVLEGSRISSTQKETDTEKIIKIKIKKYTYLFGRVNMNIKRV